MLPHTVVADRFLHVNTPGASPSVTTVAVGGLTGDVGGGGGGGGGSNSRSAGNQGYSINVFVTAAATQGYSHPATAHVLYR